MSIQRSELFPLTPPPSGVSPSFTSTDKARSLVRLGKTRRTEPPKKVSPSLSFLTVFEVFLISLSRSESRNRTASQLFEADTPPLPVETPGLTLRIPLLWLVSLIST